MSLVYITHHNENIYDLDLIKGGLEKHIPMKFHSKHKNFVKKEAKKAYITLAPDGTKLLNDAGKLKCRTMGYAQTPLSRPNEFLRKNQGVKWRRLHDHVCPPSPGLAPVPPRPSPIRLVPCIPPKPRKKKTVKPNTIQTAVPRCVKPPRADFVALNIERIKQLPTKRPPPRYVDTPAGDRHDLVNTGLIPQHVCGKNFAKVPCYLRAHKKLLEKYRKACVPKTHNIELCEPYATVHGVRKLTDEERLTLLKGLRANYSEQCNIYQHLSLYEDTQPKKMRKVRIEKDLEQLESDMRLIEENTDIYVSDI